MSLSCGRITCMNSEKSFSEISPKDVRSGRPLAMAIRGCRLKLAVLKNRRTVRTECASIRNELPVNTTQSFSLATLSGPTLSIAFASHPNSTTSGIEYAGKNSLASDRNDDFRPLTFNIAGRPDVSKNIGSSPHFAIISASRWAASSTALALSMRSDLPIAASRANSANFLSLSP